MCTGTDPDLPEGAANGLSGAEPEGNVDDRRWRLMGDVILFQGKLILDGLRDLVLSPVSLAAAVIGLATSREDPGRYFYRLMRWGRWSDQAINLFHARGAPRSPVVPPGENSVLSVDQIAGELERMLLERYAQSALAQAARHSIDRSFDHVTTAPGIDREGLQAAARRIARSLRRQGLGRTGGSGVPAGGEGQE